jgi:hypothetical protein
MQRAAARALKAPLFYFFFFAAFGAFFLATFLAVFFTFGIFSALLGSRSASGSFPPLLVYRYNSIPLSVR